MERVRLPHVVASELLRVSLNVSLWRAISHMSPHCSRWSRFVLGKVEFDTEVYRRVVGMLSQNTDKNTIAFLWSTYNINGTLSQDTFIQILIGIKAERVRRS